MYRRWLGRWPPRRRVRGLAAIQDTQTRWAEIKPPFDHLAQQHTYRIAPSDATAAISANHAGKRLAHSDGGSLIALRSIPRTIPHAGDVVAVSDVFDGVPRKLLSEVRGYDTDTPGGWGWLAEE